MHDVDTNDICLASVLRMRGFQLSRITEVRNRGVFSFPDVPDEVLEEYNLGKSLVEPIAFHSMVKSLTSSWKRMRENG